MTNPHLASLVERLPALGSCANDIESAFQMLRDCFDRGNTAFTCGNGGSAANAEHWAGELLKGFRNPRPLDGATRSSLSPQLGAGLQRALPMIPLTGFLSYRTAFANDVDPDLVFAQLVWALGRPDDVLVALSTSGESRNILFAVEAADARNMRTLALTNESGGRLASLVERAIRVPARETYRAQEFHLPIYHCLSLMLEDAFFEE